MLGAGTTPEKVLSAMIEVGLLTSTEAAAKFAGKPIEDFASTSIWGLGMGSTAVVDEWAEDMDYYDY